MTPQTAARLVTLYPGRWRDRYGDEFTHVLTDQPLTLRLLVDVIGGAVDAHLYRAMAFPALMIAVMPLYMKGATRRAKVVTAGVCLTFLAGVTYLSTLI